MVLGSLLDLAIQVIFQDPIASATRSAIGYPESGFGRHFPGPGHGVHPMGYPVSGYGATFAGPRHGSYSSTGNGSHPAFPTAPAAVPTAAAALFALLGSAGVAPEVGAAVLAQAAAAAHDPVAAGHARTYRCTIVIVRCNRSFSCIFYVECNSCATNGWSCLVLQ